MNALGRFPAKPALQRRLVVAQLSRLLEQLPAMASIDLRPLRAEEKEVTMYLDGPKTPAWTPMVETAAGDFLLTPMRGVVAERRG